MLEGSEGGYASVGVEGDEAGKQVHLQLVQGGRVLNHWHAAELREGRFEVIELEGVRPVILVRGAQHLEDFEDLIDFRVAHEQRTALDHLGKDAARGPEVNTEGVCLLSKEDLGAPIPESDDLVRVRFDWQSESPSQAEISQLDVLA